MILVLILGGADVRKVRGKWVCRLGLGQGLSQAEVWVLVLVLIWILVLLLLLLEWISILSRVSMGQVGRGDHPR